MNQLLANVLDTHCGMNPWNKYQKVEAAIVTGGVFLLSKESCRTRRHDACPCGCTRNARPFCRIELQISQRCSLRSGSPSKNPMAQWLPTSTEAQSRATFLDDGVYWFASALLAIVGLVSLPFVAVYGDS